MPTITSLLCPIDLSEMSRPVLDYAVFMAQSHGARLTLVYVVDQLHGFDSYKIMQMTAIESGYEMERLALVRPRPGSVRWRRACPFPSSRRCISGAPQTRSSTWRKKTRPI